ncbi:protein NUCLEOLAR COMPLEX ASSOCIATED 4 isoform X2 [Diospyros lotus]|uniref:protein NUCLEOLAR COMPLEX ASSOCIATED 4 isoform X2 n=1 Tax=Diospyros lotus TaxID=55363 RepID=UPI002253E1FF|nr:protein NUCLEOLAR COMPLEX ASSOCIATED 4 isoform X2 [Diospyros lotus]
MASSSSIIALKTRSKKNKKREKYSLSELKTLGHQLLSSKEHINNLCPLLTFVSPTSPTQYALEALVPLHSFFMALLPRLPASSTANSAALHDPDFIYRTWIRSKFDDFVNSLIAISVSPQSQEEALREVVLDTIMELVKVGNGGRFHSAIYHRFLHSIVHSSTGIDVLLDFLESKFFKYIDVRYFTYITLEKLARTLEIKDISENGDGNSHSRESIEICIRKILHLLSRIPAPKGINENAGCETWNGLGVFIKDGNREEHSEQEKAEDKSSNNTLSAANVAKKIKVKFTKAWISFLRLPLPLDVYKEVLLTLHLSVIPHLSNPILLCSYDIGGVTSVMALSSLYILMTQHGLDYPNFYEKLYALLVPSIFMARHRAKFFELLDTCLRSPLLPAYLAAAFAKKLSRLSLSVPPSGASIIVALIHNLLRRHPSINCLVHWEDGDPTARADARDAKDSEREKSSTSLEVSAKEQGIDHFNITEVNPIKANAMKSSLWEIDTLHHHYCPFVSRFVISLEDDLTVRSKTTEFAVKDFTSGSYATIFREEISRRVKQVPLAFYKATPTSLFSELDFVGWTFKYEQNEESIITNTDDYSKNIKVSEEHEHGCAKKPRIECS